MTTLLVTVGSTNFAPLTDAVFAAIPELATLGVSKLVVQRGSAGVPAAYTSQLSSGEGEFIYPNPNAQSGPGLVVKVLRYTADAAEMEALIAQADVVVSHAGSGTILGVLRRPNPPRLLVVPNPTLMDNHQQELADALRGERYLESCTVDTLLDALRRVLDPGAPKPKPFPAFEPSRFAGILDEVAGFV